MANDTRNPAPSEKGKPAKDNQNPSRQNPGNKEPGKSGEQR